MPHIDRSRLSDYKKARLPRPEILTPRARATILKKIRSHATMREACRAAGLTYEAFLYWRLRWSKGDPAAVRYTQFFESADSLIPPIVKDKVPPVRRSAEWKRLRYSVSHQISHHLRSRLSRKPTRTACMLVSWFGYTPDDLIVHLERLFEPGMSWGNYGEWQVDHKIPASWFDFRSPEDEAFRKCWALSNLQPKWRGENASKGNRFAE